jgi:hypothetical protein
MHQERKSVATLIRRFIAGKVHPHEWDDFISMPKRNLELDEIRKICLNIPERFPAENKMHYCSEGGIKMLLHLADQVESKKDLSEPPSQNQ